MTTVTKLTPKKNNECESGTPFIFKYPQIEKLRETKDLVSVLKKKITEAKIKARDAFLGNQGLKGIDLKIAAAYASGKLRMVIDLECNDPKTNDELILRDAIRVIDEALRN